MVVGGLVAGVSGLCSAFVLISMFYDGGGMELLVLPFLFGGIPLVIGLGIFFIGYALAYSKPVDGNSVGEDE